MNGRTRRAAGPTGHGQHAGSESQRRGQGLDGAHPGHTAARASDLTLWFDTAEIYKSRMSTIGGLRLHAAWLLVFLVLILSLRPKVALWVTAGIAVSFIGTFSLLPANDVSLNVMSTFAFLLVLGIVVDDAIVVGESIHLHAERHGRWHGRLPSPEPAPWPNR